MLSEFEKVEDLREGKISFKDIKLKPMARFGDKFKNLKFYDFK